MPITNASSYHRIRVPPETSKGPNLPQIPEYQGGRQNRQDRRNRRIDLIWSFWPLLGPQMASSSPLQNGVVTYMNTRVR